MSTMRAIVVHKFGGPSVLTLEKTHPMPKCGQNEVLLKVKSIGINPVDTYIRSGSYAARAQVPYTPGSDCAGLVEQVGKLVTRFKTGDRVFCARTVSGSYAEYCTAEEKCVWPLPDCLQFEQGAAIGVPYFTAFRALFLKCKASAGQNVLVHGASGGVGIAALQLGKANGLIMYGTAGTNDGADLVKEAGVVQVFNHREPDYIDKINAAVPSGFDVIIEMLANVNLSNDLEMLAPRGCVCIVGSRDKTTIDPRATMMKETSIVGCALYSSTDEEWQQMGDALIAAADEGQVSPKIGKRYHLEEAEDSHAEIEEHLVPRKAAHSTRRSTDDDKFDNHGTLGKIVINIH